MTHFFVQENDGQIEVDTNEKINPRPHAIYKKDNSEDLYYEDYGFNPIFRLDNCK